MRGWKGERIITPRNFGNGRQLEGTFYHSQKMNTLLSKNLNQYKALTRYKSKTERIIERCFSKDDANLLYPLTQGLDVIIPKNISL